MKYIKRIILLIAVVFATTLQAQTKTFNSQVRVKQVPLSSSLDSLVTINSSGLLTYLPKSELASGGALEFVTEDGNTGIAIKGRNPDNYGNIGNNAVDLSFSNSASTTRGAVGSNSLTSGFNNTAGLNSLVSGSNNIAEVNSISGGLSNIALRYSLVSGRSNTVGNAAFGAGREIFAPSYAETALGMFGTDYVPVNVDAYNSNDRLFSLANGINDTSRNDALIVYKSGNAILDGDLTVDNIIGNGSQLTNVAKLNQANTFTEPQLIQKASATILTVKRLGADSNVGIRLQGDNVETHIGLGADGDFKVGTNADLVGSGNLIYHSGNSSPTRTINTSTLQTSSTLNSSFPFADNPDGTIVVNKDAAQSFMYIRVSSTQWKAVSLGSTI